LKACLACAGCQDSTKWIWSQPRCRLSTRWRRSTFGGSSCSRPNPAWFPTAGALEVPWVVTALPSQVYAATAASPAIGHANVLTRSLTAVVVIAVVVVALVGVKVVMVVLLVVETVGATINALGVRRCPYLARTKPKRTTARPFTGAPSATVGWTTTHTTLTHKKKSEGDASPAANFSLLPDPSAWHAGFGSSTLSEDLWDIFEVHFFGLIFGFAMAACLFSPIPLQALLVICSFVTTYHAAILPPVMWIGALVVTIWLRPPPDDNPAIARQERRAQAQHRSRTRHARYYGSIRDHSIHRKYPISLRSMGHFIRSKAPTVNQRHLQDQLNSLHDRVLRLQQQLQTLMRPQSPTAVPNRGGEVGVQVRKNRASSFQCCAVGH